MSQFTSYNYNNLQASVASAAQIHPDLIPPCPDQSGCAPNGHFHARYSCLAPVSNNTTYPHHPNTNIHPVYSSTPPVSQRLRPPPSSGAWPGALHPPAIVNHLSPPYTQAEDQDFDELPAEVVPLPRSPPIQPSPRHQVFDKGDLQLLVVAFEQYNMVCLGSTVAHPAI
ncbi:hypothetical protein PtB15_8B529 [Puccinia triticina]|nr:hypothetical protein PtB15_8B529 [Puccinia triticina]